MGGWWGEDHVTMSGGEAAKEPKHPCSLRTFWINVFWQLSNLAHCRLLWYLLFLRPLEVVEVKSICFWSVYPSARWWMGASFVLLSWFPLLLSRFTLLNFTEVYYPLMPIFFGLGDQHHSVSLLLFGSIWGGEGEKIKSKWSVCHTKLCPKPQLSWSHNTTG